MSLLCLKLFLHTLEMRVLASWCRYFIVLLGTKFNRLRVTQKLNLNDGVYEKFIQKVIFLFMFLLTLVSLKMGWHEAQISRYICSGKFTN